MRDRRLLIPPSLGVVCSGLRCLRRYYGYYTDVLLQPLATPPPPALERLRKRKGIVIVALMNS